MKLSFARALPAYELKYFSCYRTGVADGLRAMAKKEKENEKKQTHQREQALLQSRQDAEKAEELARIARLASPVGVGVVPHVKVKT